MRDTKIFCAIALITAFYSVSCSAAEISGRASVIDGDTIEIRGTRIRLHGIDAPESDQSCTKEKQQYRCGQKSAFFLSDIISGSTVKCDQKDTDRYGRAVSECFSKGLNLNAEMVKSGWAMAYRKYSHAYISDEAHAKKNKLGMWAGEFQAPWDYRTGPTVRERSQSAGCLIKGNINAKGRKIYHLPGTTAYGKTQINERKGERWFCSEAEAAAAGWSPVHR